MNISLTKHFDQYVDDKVKSGRYESRSEVVRAALRLMENVEQRQDALPYIPNLEEKLLEGLNSPKRPLTEVDWDDIRGRVKSTVQAGKAKKK